MMTNYKDHNSDHHNDHNHNKKLKKIGQLYHDRNLTIDFLCFYSIVFVGLKFELKVGCRKKKNLYDPVSF